MNARPAVSEPFISYAQNGEDVVLWRALRNVRRGRYVDVGAADPVEYSVTNAFYRRGWRGLNVEPVPELANALRRERPEDHTVVAAAGARAETGRTFFVVEATGLSTLVPDAARRGEELGHRAREVTIAVQTLDSMVEGAGFEGQDLHFCKVDVEGAEAEVLAGFDLRRWRPWVLVIEATLPNSTETSHAAWETLVLDAGYRYCLFDGLNRFYVAEERADLAPALSVPANVLDGWERDDPDLRRQEAHTEAVEGRAELPALEDAASGLARQTLHWRALARARAAEAADLERRLSATRVELDSIRHTVSWYVTGPLRRVRPAVNAAEQRLPRPHVAGTLGASRRRGETDLSGGADGERATAAARRAVAARLDVVTGLFLDEAAPSTAERSEQAARSPTLDAALARFAAAAARTTLRAATVAWLGWLAAHGTMPDEAELDLTSQRLALSGPDGLTSWVGSVAETVDPDRPGSDARLQVLRGRVAIDVTHTASWNLHTGVQRVVRETAMRWVDRNGAVLVAWDYARDALFGMTPHEVGRFRSWRARLDDDPTIRHDPVADTDAVLLPWRSAIIIPELPTEEQRADRYRALARAGVATGLRGIGHDMIPLTANETLASGMSDAFSELLGVVKYMDRLSTVSEASAGEFGAFRAMLGAQGLPGPEVAAHPLPTEPAPVDDETVDGLRRGLALGSLPMVLVVGSHEPRKNHAVVLLAAERLWRDGHAFHLLFIGGSGWRGERFDGLVGELAAAGRPIQVVKRAAEEILWAAYRLARFSVFPSLAEGFGLPVAESLASATPVITSNFGSMAEISRQGGALLVDARSVDDVTTAMRNLLTDDDLLTRLQTEARNRPQHSWDDYAQATWTYLTT